MSNRSLYVTAVAHWLRDVITMLDVSPFFISVVYTLLGDTCKLAEDLQLISSAGVFKIVNNVRRVTASEMCRVVQVAVDFVRSR